MKKQMVKRLVALAVSGVLVIGSLAGCGNPASTNSTPDTTGSVQSTTAGGETEDKAQTEPAVPDKQFVIGIAEAQSNDEVTTRRSYLENYIAPNYNVKFIFSEQCNDDAATKAFIENCIDSGADAIIDFKSCSAQMAQLCKENGLIYTVNNNPNSCPDLVVDTFENFSGFVGADNISTAALFSDWLKESASGDGAEGFLLSTSLASQGNSQHVEITRAILEGLQDMYGLTYEAGIEELVSSPNTIDAANDKGIKITLYPGSPNKDTWLPGISSLIQTGNYGMLLSSGLTYNQSATVVNEVEASFGMDIKVASVGALGNTLVTAFNTLDPNGNSSVDLITVKPISVLTASLFAVTYNGLCEKNLQSSRDENGMPYNFQFSMIGVTSKEQLADMEGWDDKDAQNWIANTNVVDSLLVAKNPELTGDEIQTFLSSLDYEALSELMK